MRRKGIGSMCLCCTRTGEEGGEERKEKEGGIEYYEGEMGGKGRSRCEHAFRIV